MTGVGINKLELPVSFLKINSLLGTSFQDFFFILGDIFATNSSSYFTFAVKKVNIISI